jgi:hypothetical protein
MLVQVKENDKMSTPSPSSGSIMNFIGYFTPQVQFMIVAVVCVFVGLVAYVLVHKNSKRGFK